MNYEPEAPGSVAGHLAHQLDYETELMSGGFEHLEAFQQIIVQGESALPALVQDTDNFSWWRIQAICTIAGAIGKPIEYPPEVQGRYTEVRDYTVNWAKLHGYITEDSSRLR